MPGSDSFCSKHLLLPKSFLGDPLIRSTPADESAGCGLYHVGEGCFLMFLVWALLGNR
jgi:hypothetical protein